MSTLGGRQVYNLFRSAATSVSKWENVELSKIHKKSLIEGKYQENNDENVKKVTPFYAIFLIIAIGFTLISLIIMIYFSFAFPEPTEMQSSTFETCKTIFIGGVTGIFGLVFGKLS